MVGVFESRKLTEAAKILDEASNGYLSKLLAQGDMNGKINSTLLLHHVPNINSKRVLLVGLGKEKQSARKRLPP